MWPEEEAASRASVQGGGQGCVWLVGVREEEGESVMGHVTITDRQLLCIGRERELRACLSRSLDLPAAISGRLTDTADSRLFILSTHWNGNGN